MWEEVLKLAVGNGLWAVLSCVLLAYLLKDSRKREHKYTEVIDALTEKMRAVMRVKSDTEKILELLNERSVQKNPPSVKNKPAAAKITASPAAETVAV